MMNIKIVGPGCKNCTTLYELTKKVVEEIDGNFEVEHITDVSEMITLGVRQSPGVMINEEVVSQGKRLNKKDVLKLIEKYRG